jgi:hypothetical protein
MPGGFDTWGGTAGTIADSYGLNRSIFFGMIEKESSWNPQADAPTSTAYGFTQLLRGTASDLGVNRYDPVQNLNGGAKYLSGLINGFGGDVRKGLAAYHDGPGAIGAVGYRYADDILSRAKKYLGSGQGLLGDAAKSLGISLPNGMGDILNAGIPGLGTATDAFGITGDCNMFCQFKNWIMDSGFFQRLALAVLAFIVIAGAFYMMKSATFQAAFKRMKGA